MATSHTYITSQKIKTWKFLLEYYTVYKHVPLNALKVGGVCGKNYRKVHTLNRYISTGSHHLTKYLDVAIQQPWSVLYLEWRVLCLE